jgi:hypothetical protein
MFATYVSMPEEVQPARSSDGIRSTPTILRILPIILAPTES